jgi:hypothetical protein
MSDERCLGCDRRPEVYGSSWCSDCHNRIPFQARERMLRMRALIAQADPWVQTRMHRHARKAESEKTPYYRARHAREMEYCEGWLAGSIHFISEREDSTPQRTSEPT